MKAMTPAEMVETLALLRKTILVDTTIPSCHYFRVQLLAAEYTGIDAHKLGRIVEKRMKEDERI